MGKLLEVELTPAQITLIERALLAYGNGKSEFIRAEIVETVKAVKAAKAA